MARGRSNKRKSLGKLKRRSACKEILLPNNVRVLRNKKEIIIDYLIIKEIEKSCRLNKNGSGNESNIHGTFNGLASDEIISIEEDNEPEAPLSEDTLKVNTPVIQQKASCTKLPERVVTYKPGDALNISITCNMKDTTMLTENKSESILTNSTSKIDKSDKQMDVVHTVLPKINPINRLIINSNQTSEPRILDHITIPDESDTLILISPPNTPLANNNVCVNQETTSEKTAVNNINEISTIRNERTLNDMYQTIDIAESDTESDDVIFINSSSNVTANTTTTLPKKKKKKRKKSVIVIDDDSLTEVAATSFFARNKCRSSNGKLGKFILASPILNKSNRMRGNLFKVTKPITSTPIQTALREQSMVDLRSPSSSSQTTQPATPYLESISDTSNANIPNSAQLQQCRRMARILREQALQLRNELYGIPTVVGKNFLNGNNLRLTGLRPIFIDGSNVAIGHSNGKFFSVKGLKICIDYFKIRGHEVAAIVPQFRKEHRHNSNPKMLMGLEEDQSIIFTPSRKANGRNIVPYDDRYIVLLAHVNQGIIVSADNYRDLLLENPDWHDTIVNRILTPTWMRDMIMFPTDPLGRCGPKLDDFLKFPD